MHKHIGKSRENAVDSVEQRRDEKEGEFKRLGDTREHRGQSRREEKSADELSLFGTRRAVDGERRRGQTEDHKGEFSRHKSRCFHREPSGGS